MSYLVLARKYRPQRFSELVGQEHVARTLTNAIQQDRVHHAFLFTGARGVGKTSAARILAKALSCANGPTAEPCGTCDFCQEIASGRSVDVIEIDGASNTGVDDVRTLREGARYMPAKARRKVYIIDEVHMLSTSAFNALLKTLEEPPPHVVFVFATTEVHKIPTTILSRCQRYDFKLIPTARLTAHLEGILATEQIACRPDALLLLARQAAGSVRDALSLLDQVIAYVGDAPITAEVVSEVLGVADRAVLHELARDVIAQDAGAALRGLAGAAERGFDLGQLARSFLGLLRDIEVVSRVAEPADLLDVTPEELADLRRLAEAAARRSAPEGRNPSSGSSGADLLLVLFDRWARAVDEAAKSQVPRLLLEVALVDLCHAEPLEPVAELLERLEALESRVVAKGNLPPGGTAKSSSAAGASAGTSSAVRPFSAAAPAKRNDGNADAPKMGTPGSSSGAPSAAFPAAPANGTATASPAARAQGTTPAATPAPLQRSSDELANLPEQAAARSAEARPGEGGLRAAWTKVKADYEQRRPRVGALLAHAQVVEMDAGKLVLGFADRSEIEAAERARGDIEQALAAAFGAPVRLGTVERRSAAGAVVEADTASEAAAAASDRRRREQEARTHPIVQKAQDLFGVEIREIKT